TMLPDCDKTGAQFGAYPPCALPGAADSCFRTPRGRLSAGADDLDVEVADLLAKGVAVDPEQVGSADLVAAGRGQRRRQQRMFDLAQDAVIEAGRRKPIAEVREIARQMPLHRGVDRILAMPLL